MLFCEKNIFFLFLWGFYINIWESGNLQTFPGNFRCYINIVQNISWTSCLIFWKSQECLEMFIKLLSYTAKNVQYPVNPLHCISCQIATGDLLQTLGCSCSPSIGLSLECSDWWTKWKFNLDIQVTSTNTLSAAS